MICLILEKSLAIAEGRPEPPLHGREDIRPLGMDDLKFVLGQVKTYVPISGMHAMGIFVTC